MWMSGQQKRPADPGEGQTGIVTLSDGEMAVLLDSERRGVEVYAPAGYHWTPEPGQRVLVIQGRGEIPCVAGVRQGSVRPKSVAVEAGHVSVSGEQVKVNGTALALSGGQVNIRADEDAAVACKNLDLQSQVYIRGELLEDFIRRIAAAVVGGA